MDLCIPLIILSDLGKGIVRMPYTTAYQIQNYCKTFPSRHELATEEINKIYIDLYNKNKNQPKPIKISNVEYKQHLDRKRFLEDLPAIPQLPFKLITNAIIDGGGKGAWETMVRRTQTMFNSPEEFKEDAQLIVNDADRKKAKNEAKIRVIPKSTGVLSGFMDMLQDKLKKHEKDEINLIGHSMGTIVMNEILHRYRGFSFNNIVYMGAACSINDFRINVIPYLEKHENTKFFNLCLHPYAEQRESHIGGLIPRGSLLEWLDNFLTSPNTTLDRRMGKWENIVRATNVIPNEIRDRVSLKAFELGKGNTQKANKCEGCHRNPSQKPPKNPDNPQKHNEFTDQRFWEDKFWYP